jgi:hypothetical protein
MSEYSVKVVKQNSDRNDRRDFVKMMTVFREKYFNKQSPFDYNLENFSHILDTRKDIVCGLLSKQSNNVGIFEYVYGRLGNMPLASLGTLYIQPKHRSRGLSKEFYELCYKTFEQQNIAFCIHIEESKFLGNEKKFWDLGFTHYTIINEFDSDSQYKEKTYALFRKPYYKVLLPIQVESLYN